MEIETGDIVSVHFVSSESLFNCKVNHVPKATGDSWELECDGIVYYVQLFEKMVKIIDKNEAIFPSEPEIIGDWEEF